MKEIKDRILGSEKIAWKNLKPFQPDNLKTMSKESFELLKNSIKTNDFSAAFDVWKENDDNYWILDGHHRKFALEALEKEGLTVPSHFSCTLIDCKDETEACYVLASKASSHAKIDELGFSEFIHTHNLDFEQLKATLDIPGIDIEKIWNDSVEQLEPQCDEDETPGLAIEATTKIGDVWLLGNHRLVCGDSTNSLDVDKLFNGSKPNLMITDPPYGVNLDQSWRDDALSEGKKFAPGNKNKVQNDDRADWKEVYSLFTGNIAYVWHASKFTDVIKHNLEECEFDVRQMIIWNKSILVMGRSAYHWKHEPCWYAVRKGHDANWLGDRKQSTVWDAASPNNIFAHSKEDKTDHPTQKPVILFDIPIHNHTKTNDSIYDPFGGSGTALIACEKNNRKCLMMELEPKYCDIIIKRWQKYTGKKAILESTKQTFDELSPLV